MSWLVYDLCSRHRGPTYAITGTKSTPHCGICVVDVHRSSCAAQRRHSCVSDASRLVRENEHGRRTSRDGHARSCIPSFPVRAPSNTHPHCLVLVRREARRDGQRSKATSPQRPHVRKRTVALRELLPASGQHRARLPFCAARCARPQECDSSRQSVGQRSGPIGRSTRTG